MNCETNLAFHYLIKNILRQSKCVKTVTQNWLFDNVHRRKYLNFSDSDRFYCSWIFHRYRVNVYKVRKPLKSNPFCQLWLYLCEVPLFSTDAVGETNWLIALIRKSKGLHKQLTTANEMVDVFNISIKIIYLNRCYFLPYTMSINHVNSSYNKWYLKL
jgi:hypothetical protein